MKWISTDKWKKFWQTRKIDWEESYLSGVDPNSNRPMWDHPHRQVIVEVLKQFPWFSLFEVGCGAGANLVKIARSFKDVQLGGADVNKEALAVVEKSLKNALTKNNSGDDLMLSDSSTDVVMSDMCLIYVDKSRILDYLKEMKRVARNYILLCEFHSESFFNRLALKLNTGYNAHNYKKLLSKIGCYDIAHYKLTDNDWPGGNPQKTFAHIILAKVPKR